MLFFRSVSVTPLLCAGVDNHTCIQSRAKSSLGWRAPLQCDHWRLHFSLQAPPCNRVPWCYSIYRKRHLVQGRHLLTLSSIAGPSMRMVFSCSSQLFVLLGCAGRSKKACSRQLPFAFGQDALSLHTNVLRPFRAGCSTRNRGIFRSRPRLSNKKFGV